MFLESNIIFVNPTQATRPQLCKRNLIVLYGQPDQWDVLTTTSLLSRLVYNSKHTQKCSKGGGGDSLVFLRLAFTPLQVKYKSPYTSENITHGHTLHFGNVKIPFYHQLSMRKIIA